MRDAVETDRRTVLKTLGTGAVGSMALSGCMGIGTSEFQQELDEVASATSDYTDPAVAYEDGYIVPGENGPMELSNVVGNAHAVCGMGYHFANRELMGSTTATEPPILVYGVDSAGDLTLGAVEYIVPKEAGFQDAPPDIFEHDDGEEEANWAEDSPMEGMWALHAWVHTDNAEGVFHPVNGDDVFHPEGCEEIPHH